MNRSINKVKLICAVLLARATTLGLRVFRGGSATSLPGLIVHKLMPSTLEELISQIPHVIVITGTNGKTTTQKILFSILSQDPNANIVSNPSGSNMIQGLTSALLKKSSLSGKLNFTHAILEVEEGTLPKIVDYLKPEIIAVTNLFRDQLDAYGEIDITRKYLRDSIERSPTALVVLNQDDPVASHLTKGLKNKTYYVSLPTEYSERIRYEDGAATTEKRQETDFISATEIKLNSNLTTSFRVTGVLENRSIQFADQALVINAPGYFQIYNALTAIMIAKLLGCGNEKVKKGLQTFKPAFGRGEDIVLKRDAKSVTFKILLAKNPAGINANLDTIKSLKDLKIIILLNDLTADGKDISWIWDARFEHLNQIEYRWIFLAGTRSRDLAVRLKYALPKETTNIKVVGNIKESIEKAFTKAEHDDTIYVITTYTAMNKFRSHLGKKIE